MPLPPAANCFGLQTDFILILSPLSGILPCSSHTKCHVLSLAWCCPDGAFSRIRHCRVSVSTISTDCRAFPALTLPSPNQKAIGRSNCPLVVARWGWPVRVRKSGKAWWGQGRLSNLCGCEEGTGWRGSAGLSKRLVPCVSGWWRDAGEASPHPFWHSGEVHASCKGSAWWCIRVPGVRTSFKRVWCEVASEVTKCELGK